MGCIELYRGDHTEHRQKPTQIFIGFCVNLSASVSLSVSAGVMHHKDNRKSLAYLIPPEERPAFPYIWEFCWEIRQKVTPSSVGSWVLATF